MAGIVTATLDSLRSYAGSVAWGPLVRTSRAAILSLLSGIEVGQLAVREKDGSETICGKSGNGREPWPVTRLNILREAFWLRVALFADMVSWPVECC
jgi:hypothetical protein